MMTRSPVGRIARERDYQIRFIEFMPLDGDDSGAATK